MPVFSTGLPTVRELGALSIGAGIDSAVKAGANEAPYLRTTLQSSRQLKQSCLPRSVDRINRNTWALLEKYRPLPKKSLSKTSLNLFQ